MIGRLVAIYLGIFAGVLLLLSVGAYMFVGMEYASLLQPALGTPEADAGYRQAMHKVLETILLFDVPLLVAVGLASYWLARTSLWPLLAARERERQFVTDAAHELRSPLATIAAVAQHAGGEADAKSAGAFEHISQVSVEASALIGDLLTLAREPRAQLLQREPLDLAALARHVAADFEERAEERDIRLEVSAQTALVQGDERRLSQLIRNLLDNGLRHAHSRIALRVAAEDSQVKLCVEDDGDGIPEQLHEHIFERAFTTGDGAGIGLAIASWVAKAHDGTIRFDRAEPSGTRFEVFLPAYR
ncbi:MAG: HAMP domain-containing histidine kinase [Candidatus Eremiobacteraeota bacterium]|nr:HAMP domain-containing histidine kinase [Candidatus Eremiobacteraeota bacterium]